MNFEIKQEAFVLKRILELLIFITSVWYFAGMPGHGTALIWTVLASVGLWIGIRSLDSL